ncbi:hypothetical protein Cme02nite_64900 [Catellatospora methionotrophica]|uniref:Uncharacterized protein n=1 Tax=Catellatospora methionotrophica TaxID=121620 RepID=A0A8J3LC15_9ACTN|nr:hypothetical protein [Catellatospora methionotrophica]GIG18158.1 hypothetical protein Cme02nite_64900 [Catellatospora methionotrophica]
MRSKLVLSALTSASLLLSAIGAAPAAADPGTSYTFTKIFDTPYLQNQQGLAWADGSLYVSFDMGSDQGRIVQYSTTGTEIKRSGLLALGHAAEISFRQADGNFYVATGGGSNPTYVNVVDMRPATPVIKKTYNFTALGNNGMVGIDNKNDRMVVFAGPSGGPYTIAFANFSGTVTSSFTLPNLGTPQGIEVAGDQVLYYTSGPNYAYNTITVFSATGTNLYSINVPVTNEGEGLAINTQSNQLYLGFHNPRRVYSMSPVLTAPLGVNVIANPNAESGTAGPGHPTTVAIPSWTVAGGMSTIGYAVGGGYPTAASPGPAARGATFFSGGTAASATLTQTANIATLATDVDAADINYSLAGYLGGYLTQTDNAKVVVTFKNSGGTSLGTAQIGPVSPADRANVTGLLQRTTTGTVPVGTRTITVVVTSTRDSGTNNDGYFDNLSLVLTKP